MTVNKQIEKAMRKDPELQKLLYTILKNRGGINGKFVPKCIEAADNLATRLREKHGISIFAYIC